MASPDLNASASATLVVSSADLASSLSLTETDTFPAVFATARMIALMEIAAARTLTSILDEGQMSVGVSVDVTHGAPTPLGAKVVAEARYEGRTGKGGKLYGFEVWAKDEGGEIGRGKHVRAVVDMKRLEGAAVKRVGGNIGEGLKGEL